VPSSLASDTGKRKYAIIKTTIEMNTTTKITALLSVASLLFLSSCEDFGLGCIRGNNRITTEYRTVGNFNEVSSGGNFVVEVTTGTSGNIEIEGDENLLSYIETYVQGNRLVIGTRNDKCIRSSESIRVRVPAMEIRALKLSGSGAIYCDHITADELFLDVSGSGIIECHAVSLGYIRANLSGSGTIEVWGRSIESDLILSGSGLIKTLNLEQDNCYATISGSGNIYANVLEKLDVSISGSGNIYYSGNPEITKSITGSGNVRRY
jgi:hypothetical protein